MQKPDFSTFILEADPHCRLPVPQGEFWVFGYGSLMWDPGFDFSDTATATLYGYHRRLCLWSIRYRGTAASPGLVLGLAPGGSCRGRGFKVCRSKTDEVLVYLKRREMLSDAYLPSLKPIYLETQQNVQALTFISKPQHPQFAPPMDTQQAVDIISAAVGERGHNRDYVLNTATHLSAFGIRNTELHRIAAQLNR